MKPQIQQQHDPAGRPVLLIQTAHASARLSLYGAQILGFRPTGAAEDLFYLSPDARYRDGTAIRGGIPLCWPWFGPDTSGRDLPAHGIARLTHWELADTATHDDGSATLTLRLPSRDNGPVPPGLSARLVVDVGATLGLTLVTRNDGGTPAMVSQALHSYLRVGDQARVGIPCLGGVEYLDKQDDGRLRTETTPPGLTAPFDRVYLGAPDVVRVTDPALSRVIEIETTGSHSLVVWNPGAAVPGDMPAQDAGAMLCVEPANVAADSRCLEPGQSHELQARYRMLPLTTGAP